MIISIIYALRSLVLPGMLNLILEPILLLVIIILGICMALGCIGIKFNKGIGSAFINNIFKAIAYVLQLLWKGLLRVFMFLIMISPKVFHKISNVCSQKGLSQVVSRMLGGLAVILIWVIVI